MLHRWVAFAGLGAAGLGLLACGAGGVYFSGKGQPPRVEPAQVASGDRAPAGQRRLGQLTVDCSPVDAAEGLDGAWLSDVSCSQALLLAALKERAASEGGTFLLDPRCSGEGGSGSSSPSATVRCSAELWGPVDGAAFNTPPVPERPVNVDPRGPAAPGAPPLGSVAEAWRVRIDFWPAPGQAPRAPVAPEQVAEVDFPRVGQVSLGDLRAQCREQDCSEGSARTALRAAAARVGATSLVAIRCVRGPDDAPACVANAAALAHDEAPLAAVAPER